jgi:tetratricopeptide (TPR) repeat protein
MLHQNRGTVKFVVKTLEICYTNPTAIGQQSFAGRLRNIKRGKQTMSFSLFLIRQVRRIRAWFYNLRGSNHRHLGNSYADLDEYDLAVQDFGKAIAMDPSYVEPYYNRGVLYWREFGNYYRAIRDLTRVIELSPQWAEAHFNRGLAYKLHGDRDRAIADFQRYLQIGHDAFWLEASERQLRELEDD